MLQFQADLPYRSKRAVRTHRLTPYPFSRPSRKGSISDWASLGHFTFPSQRLIAMNGTDGKISSFESIWAENVHQSPGILRSTGRGRCIPCGNRKHTQISQACKPLSSSLMDVGESLYPRLDVMVLSCLLFLSQVALPSYEEALCLPTKNPEGDPAPPPYSEV